MLLSADHRVSNQHDTWARFAVIVQENGRFVFSARRWDNRATSSYICQLQEGTMLMHCVMENSLCIVNGYSNSGIKITAVWWNWLYITNWRLLVRLHCVAGRSSHQARLRTCVCEQRSSPDWPVAIVFQVLYQHSSYLILFNTLKPSNLSQSSTWSRGHWSRRLRISSLLGQHQYWWGSDSRSSTERLLTQRSAMSERLYTVILLVVITSLLHMQ